MQVFILYLFRLFYFLKKLPILKIWLVVCSSALKKAANLGIKPKWGLQAFAFDVDLNLFNDDIAFPLRCFFLLDALRLVGAEEVAPAYILTAFVFTSALNIFLEVRASLIRFKSNFGWQGSF